MSGHLTNHDQAQLHDGSGGGGNDGDCSGAHGGHDGQNSKKKSTITPKKKKFQ